MADKVKNTVDTSSWILAGRNVKLNMLDGILFIAVDTTAKAYEGVPLSDKGNATIATSGGNMLIPVAPNLKLGLNVFGKPPAVLPVS